MSRSSRFVSESLGSSLGPCRSLITSTVKGPRDQEFLVVTVVDDMILDDRRANAFATLWPIATQARLFDEQLESVETGVNQPIGDRGKQG